MADFRARAAKFFEKGVGVSYADPDPTASVSLITLREEDGAAAARDGGKALSLPVDVEAELLRVVEDAGFDVLHTEDGSGAFESGWWRVFC